MPRLQRLTLNADQIESGRSGSVVLTSAQSHYLLRVLRLGAGDRFLGIADSAGEWWELVIANDLSNAVLQDVVENDRELAVDIELAIALPKSNHLEMVISPAVELGIARIIPLYSDRSLMQPHSPPSSQKQQRWQKLACEASELSCRSRIPPITPPMPLDQFLEQCSSNHRFICVTSPAQHLSEHLPQVCAGKSTLTGTGTGIITVMTGCEGGWTVAEQARAVQQGFIPVSLGDRVLSATTAPVVALAMITSAIEMAR